MPLRSELVDVTCEATDSIWIVQSLVEVVENMGVPRQRFLKAAQLEAAWLEHADARLPRSKVGRACEIALDLTADPAFGLHWAERLTANAFNLISHLVAHAANLRQAFETLFQFAQLLTDRLGLELIEREKTVEVRYALSPGTSQRARRLESEMVTLGLHRVVRALGAHARADRVTFEYSAPAHHAEYTRVFDGAEQFDQPFTGMVFDRALMNAASPRKDEDLHHELCALAKRQIARLAHDAPYAVRVRDSLMKRVTLRDAGMQSVARSLGVSERSLRRHLAAEGTSYTTVAKDAFATRAMRLLRDEQRSIQETAYEMGFTNPNSFHRAFKRCTGTTPNAVRGQH
jgi:AraC-like DNA-binding protein